MAETLARLADLARTTMRGQAELARQSVELTRAALSGELDRSSAGRAYVEALGREGLRYWRGVTELGIDYAHHVVDLGNRVSSQVLSETAATGRRPAHRPDPSRTAAAGDGTGPVGTPTRRVPVTLRGPVGGRAEGSVTVVNRHSRARRVQLVAGPLTDELGALVGVDLEVEPARVTVPAGQDRAVTLGLDLGADHLEAGATYAGNVEISGGDEAVVDVTVEVTA